MKLLNLFAAKSLKTKAVPENRTCLKNNRHEPLYAISGGRSMVEMLGVLAIIGVLSVGAISGYSTAMYKYRMNKTIQTVTDVMQNLLELSTKDWGDLEINSSAEYVKYGLLPASMCPADYADVYGEKGYACKLPLGEISMDFAKSTPMFDNPNFIGDFYIRFYEGDIVKSCVDFLSHGWQNMYPPEWLRTDENMSGSLIAVNDRPLWGGKGEVWGEDVPTSVTLSDIQNVCDFCKGEEVCRIYMVINHEL